MTPASAIRDRDWKLLHFYEDDRRELYDLSSDPGEQSNVAVAHPERARQLYRQLDLWRNAVGANSPQPNVK